MATQTEQVQITRLDVDNWLRAHMPLYMSVEHKDRKGVWLIGLDTPFIDLGATWEDVHLALIRGAI